MLVEECLSHCVIYRDVLLFHLHQVPVQVPAKAVEKRVNTCVPIE
jgi:hypothetical protein